jgi:hypothetical protein
MKYITPRVASLAVILSTAAITSCETTPGSPFAQAHPDYLSVHGPLITDPAVVRSVIPASPADGKIAIGDTIMALGSDPVRSIDELFSILDKATPSEATLRRVDGSKYTVPISTLLDESTFQSWALPIAPGETLGYQGSNLDGATQQYGYVFAGATRGGAALTMWPGSYRLLEVAVTLQVPPDCTDCELRNIALMDWDAKSWLQVVSINDAATIAFPDLGAPKTLVSVPPPIPVAYSGVSTTTGTVQGSTFGNSVYGTYSGVTTGTVTPYYDYTATNMAQLTNLAVAIRNSQIDQRNAQRAQFVAKRYGNLRLGKLNPGERLAGARTGSEFLLSRIS